MHGTNRARTGRWLAAACGLLLLVTGSCTTDDNTGPTGPSDRGVVVRDVTVTPSLLEVGQVAIVEVYVTDSTFSPFAARVIRLTAAPSSAGTFNGGLFQTDLTGIATATFTAAAAGSVTITAHSEDNLSSDRSTTITILDKRVDSNGVAISLSITPSLMPANGQSTASVLATVTDLSGNAVADSTPVKFTAGEKFADVNGDGVWTENVDELIYDADEDGLWDPAGLIDPIGYTEDGLASATFTADHRPGLVYIKVTAGEIGHQVGDDIEVSLTPIAPIKSIALTPEWQRIQVRGTGGIEWVRIVAQAFDSHGYPAPENLPMSFSIMEGPGGGENLDGDPVGPVSALTNSLGQATVTLNAGSISGTVVIRARTGSVVSEATQVTIRSGPAAYISVGADTCNLGSWPYVNVKNGIVALVYDMWGNEVADSTAVWFGCEQGLIEGAAETQIVYSTRGEAGTVWHSAFPKDDPYVYYWAQTAGGTVADTGIFFESGPAESGTFVESPDTLYADGASWGRVIIEVLDLNDIFMVDGTPILVEAELGTIESGFLRNGCYSSTYVGRYTAPTLDRDHLYSIPDDGIGAIDIITTNVGGTAGFNGEVEIVLRTGPAVSDNSEVIAPASLGYGITVPIEVTIRDRWNNPLGGHLIELVTDNTSGRITGSPQYTNAFGAASGFKFTSTSDVTVTRAYITMNDLDPAYGGMSIVQVINLLR